MENSLYMEAVTSARSMLQTEEEGMAGEGTVSIETEGARTDDFYTYTQEHFPAFLRLLRFASPEEQEMVLSYYICGRSQLALGSLFGRSQTQISYKVRMAVKTMLARFRPPTEKEISKILKRYRLSLDGMNAAQVVLETQTKTAERVLREHKKHGVPASAIRNLLRDIYAKMKDSPKSEEALLAVWVHASVALPNNYRRLHRTSWCHRQDPSCLGEFRVALEDPNWTACFTAKAEFEHNQG
jgi:hypothetical protein